MNFERKRILFVYPEPYFVSAGGIATYLEHAMRAHLEASHEVHLLTWLTSQDSLFGAALSDEQLLPLRREQITIKRFNAADIDAHNPVAVRAKNISDMLAGEIIRLEREFRPDVIEGSDYQFPLHSYLQLRMCGQHVSSVPTVTFCHGMLQDIFPASALKPSDYAMREMVMERQVLSWSDYVFAPSEAAARNVAENVIGNDATVRVVREPFAPDSWHVKPAFAGSNFIYFGRISFAKGADIYASMMTSLGMEAWPIGSIAYLGRAVTMPFRRSDPQDFLTAKLHPDLRDKLRFLPAVERRDVPAVLERYDFFANFSRSETFSYTTLEALSRGIVPLVLADSPMAELLPEAIRGRGTFREAPHRTEVIRDILEYWKQGYPDLIEAVQRHAAELTAPATYAAAYRTMQSRRVVGAAQQPFRGEDVSIIMTTYNDSHLLVEALASIERQTVKPREVLVLDDGSSDASSIARLDELVSSRRIRLLSVRNMGLVAGRNVLIENAQTPLVIFLDSDDYLAPTYVEKTLLALNTDPAGLSAAITRRRNFGLNGHEIACFLLHTPLHWLMNDFRMTALIKRDVLAKLRFDPGIRNGEADDWWWWLRFDMHGYKAVHVPDALFHYRTVAGSMSLPWSQGQGALTGQLLRRATREAAELGLDLSQPMQWVVAAAYKRAWEMDELRASTSVLAPDARPIPERRIWLRQQLSSILGEERLVRILRFGRRTAASYPRLAQSALYVLKKLKISAR